MRTVSHHLACLLLAAGASWTVPAAAQNSLPGAAKCKAGADAKATGFEAIGNTLARGADGMSKGVKGAVTVSPAEAKCLIDALGDRLLVIQVMTDDRQLPRAQQAPDLGSWDTSERAERHMAERLTQLTGGDKTKPVLFYCHHASCQLSYNATVRATQAGYRSVFWLREGNSGWVKAGLPLKGDELGKSGSPVLYEKELQVCDRRVLNYEATDHAQKLVDSDSEHEVHSSFQTDADDLTKHHTRCLERLRARYAANKGIVEDLNARIARSDREIQARVANIGRYTCTRKPNVNCVPDTSWRSVADVVNAGDLEFIKRASLIQASREADIVAAVHAVNAWLERVNNHVQALNEEHRNRRSHSSTWQSPYTPPAATTPRVNSSTSAPGIR